MDKKVSPAIWGWLGVVGVVVGYDGWALVKGQETMTAFFYRLIDPPQPEERKAVVSVIRGGVVTGLIGTAWHLLSAGKHLLPEPYYLTYRKVHPLWRLHDIAITRAANGQVIAVPLTNAG